MGAVADFVEDVVGGIGDAVGDVVEAVGDVAESIITEVVEPVMDTVGRVVESAFEDPIGTAAKVATAVFAPELLPLVSAADTVAHGGDLEDALKSAATTYVAQGIGGYANQLGDQLGAAAEYGTDIGSQQTAMLAAQEAGLGSLADRAGNVIGSTAAGIVRGQDPLQALISGGISEGTKAVTSQIEGFDSLPKSVQNSVNSVVAATLKGGDPSQALINAAINTGIAEARSGMAAPAAQEQPATAEPAPETAKAVEESIAPTETPLGPTPSNQDILDSIGYTPPEQPAPEEPAPEQPLPDELATKVATQDVVPVTDAGLPTLAESTQSTLQDNGDGTYTRTMKDGSQIIEDEFGNPLESKSATQVAFEDQTDQQPEQKTQDQMTAEDWAKLYATPTTNPDTGETITGADLSEYSPQDFGADTGQYWDEYQKNLQDIASTGGFTSQWVTNDDGTHTYTDESTNSSITVDDEGNIVGFTEGTDTTYTPPSSTPTTSPTVNVPTTDTTSTTGPSAAGLDALYKMLLGGAGLAAISGGQTQPQETVTPKDIALNWNQADINRPQRGVAYGQQYINPEFREVQAAQGGLMSLATGGSLGGYSDGGRLLRGPGDGMSDGIPASIANKQPARLADGEFVIPADVVSHLGNGSTEAGSRVLYDMMNKVRKARTGNPKQGKQINPKKFVPR